MRTVLAGNEAGTLYATCHQRRGPFMGWQRGSYAM